jgi:hypothetical protein
MQGLASDRMATPWKGVQQMRTLRELDSVIEIVNDPVDQESLSNQPSNDPDD